MELHSYTNDELLALHREVRAEILLRRSEAQAFLRETKHMVSEPSSKKQRRGPRYSKPALDRELDNIAKAREQHLKAKGRYTGRPLVSAMLPASCTYS